MKTHALVLIAFCLSPLTSFAASSWQCDGANIEGLTVDESQGNLMAGVAWDCFPGGGVCHQSAAVTLASGEGETVIQGPSFKLVIDAPKVPSPNVEYKGHITATDMSDAAGAGRGLSIDEEVDCTKASNQNQ